MRSTHYCTRMLMLVLLVLVPLAGSVQVVAAQGGIGIESVTASSYGTYNGVEYVKHEGRFVGTSAGDYSVPFQIMAPADPTRGNGAVLVEPIHSFGTSPGGLGYLTAELLFARGFSLAVVGWHPDDVDPFVAYSTEDAVEILHNFAAALRQDPEARALVGEVRQLYGIAVSKTCEPMHELVHSPGNSLLDLTLLMVPTWPSEVHDQPEGSNPVMVFLTESDLVRAQALSIHTEALRGSSATYRSYEVGGAPHVPDLPFVRAVADPMGLSPKGTTPVDWTPVARALFLAGHQWVTEGIEPPPTMMLAQAPSGQTDPVYQSKYGLELNTGIARDAVENAIGGIRLPDLAIGRGQYIAFDPASFAQWGLYGAFEDLKCEALPDGSPRFADHAAYVSQFTQQAESLVAQGFLLREDADRMIAQAVQSDVGMPEVCVPGSLPGTGDRGGGEPNQFLAWAGLALVGVVLGLRHRARVARQSS